MVRSVGGAPVASERKVLGEICGQLSSKISQLICEKPLLRRAARCSFLIRNSRTAGHSSPRCRTNARNCAAISSVRSPPLRRPAIPPRVRQ